MTTIPNQKIQDELPGLKKLVQKTKTSFNENYKRFNEFRKFVYETTITQGEKEVNETLNRDDLEFNVVTAYLSRMCGEFSKQEPSIKVSRDEGAQIDSKVISTVEGHFRHIVADAKKSNTQYHTYRDALSGGFASLNVFTEYANPMSMKQVIKVRKSKYPTLCGYDTLATEPHKGDGNYSFQIYPKTKDDFTTEYPDVDIEDIKFQASDSLGGFSWSFNNGQDDILLLCRLFKKKKHRVKIMEAADGKTYTEEKYKEMLDEWHKTGKMEQAPAIAGKPRMTIIETICRYIFIENKIIEYNETDFNNLPDVFVDGDSIDLYDDEKGSIKQHCRPYAYNAKGGQQLKNLAGQCLAGYLNNISQHKYIVKKEAIPQEKAYQGALTNLQIANTIVVNAFKDNNPNHPISEPILPIQPQSAPPEIMGALEIADKIIQNELGSYDAALGINDNQLSGVAIVEGATQSNAAAMPHIVNYVSAWNQIAVICVDLMPKYYKTPMTIPIIDERGVRSAVRINDPNDPKSIDFNYDSNLLQVNVTADVNWAIQKTRALNQIIAMMRASPGFADFMNKKGLHILLDNLDIRGIDMLKDLVEEYEQEQAQLMQEQKKMQQEMMANNPKIMSEHTKAFSAQSSAALKEKELQLQEQMQEVKLQESQMHLQAAMVKAQAEEERARADSVRSNAKLHLETLDMHHRHGKDVVDMAHKVHGKEEVKNEKT